MPQVLKSLSGWPPSVVAWSIAIPMTAALLVQVYCGHSSEKRNENVGILLLPYLLAPLALLLHHTVHLQKLACYSSV